MKRRSILLFVATSLVVAAMVLASCGGGGGATTTTGGGGGQTTKFQLETPKTGGTITAAANSDPLGWDPTKLIAIYVGHMMFTSNELLQGDWTAGPQGSHKTDWEWGFLNDYSLEVGELAESWSFPDPTHIVFNLRHGVKYHNKPPANGREMTADDVVWNMEMQFNYPTAWEAIQYPPTKAEVVTGKVLPGDSRRPTAFKAVDKYTFEVTVPADSRDQMFGEIGDNAYVNPPECWVGPDAKGMTDWHNVIGTGPFTITDFTSGSSITYTRNPDYFEIDPLYPGKNYKWPYAETFKMMIVKDLASRLSLFRTGKLDLLTGVTPDDAKPVLSQNNKILYSTIPGTGWVLSGREDKPNLPFKDLKVRRALNMAVNKQEMLNDYWKGEANLIGYPYAPTAGFAKMYTPLEQMPADVQELWKYDPEKAKALLKDAGYPNGFTAKVDVPNQTAQIDELSLLKGYLAKVNVVVNIQVDEVGAWNAMDTANSQEEMWFGMAKGIWNPAEQLMVRPNTVANDSMINDPYFETIGKTVAANIISHPDVAMQALKESGVYELGTAWGIWTPVPYNYIMYWPWLKNYAGINWTGWAGIWDWSKSVYIDPDLKKSMGY